MSGEISPEQAFAWMYDGDINEFYDALGIPVEFRQ